MSAQPGFIEPRHPWHPRHRPGYGPLYAIGAVILGAGLVVGFTLPGVSGTAVLIGVAALAGLIVALVVVGKRDEKDHSDEYVYDFTPHQRPPAEAGSAADPRPGYPR